MLHILVVDDCSSTRHLVAAALSRRGWDVRTASSGEDARRSLGERLADVIVLDVEMPDEDGVDCLRKLKANCGTAQIPVVMMSALPARDVVLRTAKMGVRAFVAKNEELCDAIPERILQLVGDTASRRASKKSPADRNETSHQPPSPPAIVSEPSLKPEQVLHAAGAPQSVSNEEDSESLRCAVGQLDPESLDVDRAIGQLRALRPFMSRSQLMQRVIADSDLRTTKSATQRVLTLADSASSSIETVADAIKQDQGLSLKILKIANSPLFARGDRVETVRKAVARIGVAQIKQTVLSLGVMEQFGSVSLAGRIRADHFWEHSLAVGMIASRIARIRNMAAETTDSMFTAGLLHDVGRAVFAEKLGEEYGKVIDVAENLQIPLEIVEGRLLLMNHAELTEHLLRSWRFAPEMIAAISRHHLTVANIRRSSSKCAETIATLGMADALAHALLLGSSGNHVLPAIGEFATFLSLSASDIAEIAASVPGEVDDMRLAMMLHGSEQQSSHLEITREQLGSGIRARVISPVACDPVSLAFERLYPGSTEETEPNVLVLRIGSPKDRSHALGELTAVEAVCGVSGLPVVVLGNSPACAIGDGALGDRRILNLSLPVHFKRLGLALRDLVDASAESKNRVACGCSAK